MHRHGNPRGHGGHQPPHVHEIPAEPSDWDEWCDWLIHVYGGPEPSGGANESRGGRDRRVRPGLSSRDKEKDEAAEKEKERERNRRRISESEAEKSPTLTIKQLDLHVSENTAQHHTDDYEITQGHAAKPVLRRGAEFKVTITFDRPYRKVKDDLLFILSAEEDEDKPVKKNLRVTFQLDEEQKQTYSGEDDWCARLVSKDRDMKQAVLAVYIPGNCPVGEWDLKVRTRLVGSKEDFVYKCPVSLIILFNPWSDADQVCYIEDKTELNEYILNNAGTVFRGSIFNISGAPWNFGQFDKGILLICLSLLRKAFGFKMTPSMADAVMVARALSRIVNSSDDEGVLVGNWTGDYSGGRSPSSWASSTAILNQFNKTGKSVEYGQCWVFSLVLTTVCRALGLPCRSVTNFSSAHDADRSCTIDRYVGYQGDIINDMSSDSIWNFHVWNEVWMKRPDLDNRGKYDGWHVIDATPQEESGGFSQCGPCPVLAVKQGDINVGYDTLFVFSEVNADVIDWSISADGEFDIISSNKTRVGKCISTKFADGLQDSDVRMDITHTYKYPAGSKEEREAVKRAVCYTCHGKKIYTTPTDLEVSFYEYPPVMVGKEMVVTSLVTNVTKEDREVRVFMAISSCSYWDNRCNSKKLAVQQHQRLIKAGQTEKFDVSVTCQQYVDSMDDSLSLYGYVCAKDFKTNMPVTNQQPFTFSVPKMDVKGPKTALSGQPVTLTMSFTNPLPIALTVGIFWVSTNLELDPKETTVWENVYTTLKFKYPRDVKAQETIVLPIRLVGKVEKENKDLPTTTNVRFECDQLTGAITGVQALTLKAQ